MPLRAFGCNEPISVLAFQAHCLQRKKKCCCENNCSLFQIHQQTDVKMGSFQTGVPLDRVPMNGSLGEPYNRIPCPPPPRHFCHIHWVAHVMGKERIRMWCPTQPGTPCNCLGLPCKQAPPDFGKNWIYSQDCCSLNKCTILQISYLA